MSWLLKSRKRRPLTVWKYVPWVLIASFTPTRDGIAVASARPVTLFDNATIRCYTGPWRLGFVPAPFFVGCFVGCKEGLDGSGCF